MVPMMAPEGETNLFADLGNMITDKLEEFINKIKPKDKRYAPFLPYADSITVAPNSLGVMKLQGPTRGRFWYVRKLRLSGVTPLGASSNSEYTFSGGANGAASSTITSGGVLQTISFQLNTDGTIANRVVQVAITEANNRVIYQVTSPFGQPASTTTEYSLAPGVQLSANGSPPSVTMPIPPNLVIPPGGHVVVTTQASDPGDTITNGTIFLQGNSRGDVFICPDDLRSAAAIGQCPITSWRDQITTIPGVNSYGVGELRVPSQECLYVAVSNGSLTAQSFVASCEAYEWPDVDENVEWVM